jgi:hypothetical protein
VPDGPPPRDQRPDYGFDAGASREGERRQGHVWDDFDECVAYVRRYLHDLPAGRRACQRDYAASRRAQPDGPWPSKFNRHGGWAAVLAAARKPT